MRLRGHEVLVLTSMHSLISEHIDAEIERRFLLNGAFGHPRITSFNDLKKIEVHNHAGFCDTVQRFRPDVIHVFSLSGLSKSLLFALRAARVPVVYDVADFWMAAEVKSDPWLWWWNSPSTSMLGQSARAAMELSGERGRIDAIAATRLFNNYSRLPELFTGTPEPDSINAFVFDRIYFCSEILKQSTRQAGFRVSHAEIIYPGIQTAQFFGPIKPQNAPMTKFLIVSKLNEESGVLTALKALKRLRDLKIAATLNIYGRGESNYIADLRSYVVRYQLPVEFLNVSNASKDMATIYRQHDVLVYPAEWNDPFPTLLLEAMACGLPIVGAQSGGANELLRHGENAFTYTAGNDVELATRMQEIQLQPALRCQATETAQAEVLSNYNESNVTDRIENYLNTSQEIWAHTEG